MHSNDIKVYFKLKSILSEVLRNFSEQRRQKTIIWQSLPILSKVLILIPLTIMILFLFAFTFSILLILVFAIPGLFLFVRWFSVVSTDDSSFNTRSMKVPTFYSTKEGRENTAFVFIMSVFGVIFGGIHCAGWFFNFPSSDEAMLWRVSSAVLTGTAFL